MVMDSIHGHAQISLPGEEWQGRASLVPSKTTCYDDDERRVCMVELSQVVVDIEKDFQAFLLDAWKGINDQNRAAARRARTQSVHLRGLLKAFREASLDDES